MIFLLQVVVMVSIYTQSAKIKTFRGATFNMLQFYIVKYALLCIAYSENVPVGMIKVIYKIPVGLEF